MRIETLSRNIKVTDAVEAIVAHFESKGHSKRYMKRLREIFGLFKKYCADNATEVLSADLIHGFMSERYDIKAGMAAQKPHESRVMNALLDFIHFDEVRMRTACPLIFPQQFTAHVDSLIDELRRRSIQENTVNKYKRSLYHLTIFLNGQGVKSVAEVSLPHFNDYIKSTFRDHGMQHAAQKLRTMRLFARFLHERGKIAEDFSEKLLRIKNSAHCSPVPSAFSKEEVERLLAVVDRGSPVGKRDYAILIVAAKLGLRSGDIRRLRFDSIDWESRSVRISQSKTGEPLALPLPPDVGWAIIDYIKNGRPVSDSAEIFVRQVAPHTHMLYFDNIMTKYLRMAKIAIPRGKHHGLHSLRHSLATTLLEKETPLPVIQEVLGHIDPNSTAIYTAVDIRQLKECALEVPYEG